MSSWLKRCGLVLPAALTAWALAAASGQAQFIGGNPNAGNLPAPAAGNVQQSATPDQVRNLFWLRALQSRSGGRGVQRGVPQFVPFGSFGPQPAAMPGNSQQPQLQQQSLDAAQKQADRDAKKQAAREHVRAQREAAEQARQARIQARLQAQQGGGDPQ